MSNASVRPESQSFPDASTDQTLRGAIATRLLAQCRAVGFWSAIVLPLGYLPLLAVGIHSSTRALTFFGLLVANILALYVGRNHSRN